MSKSLLIYLFIAGWSFPASALHFYVSTTGDDANPGTQTQPWKTIQYAAHHAVAGSTVYIMAGTYYEEVSVGVDGTPGNPITFTHFANDDVTIDGGSTNAQKLLLTISNRKYIRIVGLQFAHAMGNFSVGILVEENSDHIELIDNEIYNIHFSPNPADPVTPNMNTNPLVLYNSQAVTPLTNVTIRGNHIHDCRTGYSEALTAVGNVDGFLIDSNTVHDITNIGIDVAGGYGTSPSASLDAARNGVVSNNLVYNCVSAVAVAAGIYMDGSYDILVEHNVVHDCGRGYEVGCERPGVANNIIVRDNIAWHNREAAIGIGGYNYPATGKVINSQILNNTCYDNAWTNDGDDDDNGELLIEYTENCLIRNNVFYATNPTAFILTADLNSLNLDLSYNLYYHNSADGAAVKIYWNGAGYVGFEPYRTATGKDLTSLFTDPLLVDPAAHDFHLTPVSPAYDAGDPAFVPVAGETDLDGDNRRLSVRVDIGVDELSSLTNIAIVDHKPLTLNVFPNPTAGFFVIKSNVPWERAILYNALGQVVRVFRFSESTRLDGLATGVYWLDIFLEKNPVPVAVPLWKR